MPYELLNNCIEDQLRVEGIDSKGFGKLAKQVMTDPSLTPAAKLIYACLVSHTGGGLTAFPGRSLLLKELGIQKNTYYKHISLLFEKGYISQKRIIKDNLLSHNIYTVAFDPLKKGSKHGIYENGWGSIPNLIFRDDRLSWKAKLMYAYLSVYADPKDRTCNPGPSLMQHDLSVGVNWFKGLFYELTGLGYIYKKQTRINGKMSTNIYELNDNPVPYHGFCDIGKCDIEKQDIEKCDIGICDTNNTIINNTIINNTISISPSPDKKTGLMMDGNNNKDAGHILQTAIDKTRLGEAFRKMLKSAVSDLTDSRTDNKPKIYDKIGFFESLESVIGKDEDGSLYSKLDFRLLEKVFTEQAQGKLIRNPAAYVREMLYHEIMTGASSAYSYALSGSAGGKGDISRAKRGSERNTDYNAMLEDMFLGEPADSPDSAGYAGDDSVKDIFNI